MTEALALGRGPGVHEAASTSVRSSVCRKGRVVELRGWVYGALVARRTQKQRPLFLSVCFDTQSQR